MTLKPSKVKVKLCLQEIRDDIFFLIKVESKKVPSQLTDRLLLIMLPLRLSDTCLVTS